MSGKTIRMLLLPIALVAGLGACANNAVQPGIVSTSGSSVASAPPYVSSQPSGNQAYGNQAYGNTPSYASAQPGETGRVVSINDVSLRGGGGPGSGSGNGTMIGGLLGGLGGIAIGASSGRGLGGGLVGGVLGAVGGAIAGTILDNHTNVGGGRGIEVTVQKDSGQTVTVAQRDDGDVQLGDRVQIVQGRGGVAKVVRDNSRQPDYTAVPAPQDYRQPSGTYDPAPQDYRTTRPADDPPPQDYRQTQYVPPVSTTRTPTPYQRGGSQDYRQAYPQPADDPRYGTLD